MATDTQTTSAQPLTPQSLFALLGGGGYQVPTGNPYSSFGDSGANSAGSVIGALLPDGDTSGMSKEDLANQKAYRGSQLLAGIAGLGKGFLDAGEPSRFPIPRGRAMGLAFQSAIQGMSAASTAALQNQFTRQELVKGDLGNTKLQLDARQQFDTLNYARRLAGLPELAPPASMTGSRPIGIAGTASDRNTGINVALSSQVQKLNDSATIDPTTGKKTFTPEALQSFIKDVRTNPLSAAGTASALGQINQDILNQGGDPNRILAIAQGKISTHDPLELGQAILQAGLAKEAGAPRVAALQKELDTELSQRALGRRYDPTTGVWGDTATKFRDVNEAAIATAAGGKLGQYVPSNVTPSPSDPTGRMALPTPPGQVAPGAIRPPDPTGRYGPTGVPLPATAPGAVTATASSPLTSSALAAPAPGGGGGSPAPLGGAPTAPGAIRPVAGAAGLTFGQAEAGKGVTPAQPGQLINKDTGERITIDQYHDANRYNSLVKGGTWVTPENMPQTMKFALDDNSKRYEAAGVQLDGLQSHLKNLQQREALINSGQLSPGYVQDHLQPLAELAQSLGLLPAGKDANITANKVYEALSTGAVFGQKSLENIQRLTNFDVSLFQKQIPTLSTNPQAMKALTRLERLDTNFSIDKALALRDYLKVNGDNPKADPAAFEKNWTKTNQFLPKHEEIGINNMLHPENSTVPMFKNAAELAEWTKNYGWTLKSQSQLNGLVAQKQALDARDSQGGPSGQ